MLLLYQACILYKVVEQVDGAFSVSSSRFSSVLNSSMPIRSKLTALEAVILL